MLQGPGTRREYIPVGSRPPSLAADGSDARSSQPPATQARISWANETADRFLRRQVANGRIGRRDTP